MTIIKQGYTLVHQKTGLPVADRELVTSSRADDTWIVMGGSPPHKPSSTGRVWVQDLKRSDWNREFFPSVFNLEWRYDNETI
jgi:hypothetical protein